MVTVDPHSTSGPGLCKPLSALLTLLAVLSAPVIAHEASNSLYIHKGETDAARAILAAGQKSEMTSPRKGKKGLSAPLTEEKSKPAAVKQPAIGTQATRTTSVIAKNTAPRATKRVEPPLSKTASETTRKQQAKVEPSTERKADLRTESRTESRPQPRPELKAESRTAARAESKTEPHIQSRAEPIAADADADRPPQILAATDRIEVIEWGSRPKGENGSSPRTSNQSSGRSSGRINVSTRRIEVEIDPPRVTQIQQALAARGFLTAEPTGVYDDATIDAMRRFQIAERIDATGYPTAHSLKRLGL